MNCRDDGEFIHGAPPSQKRPYVGPSGGLQVKRQVRDFPGQDAAFRLHRHRCARPGGLPYDIPEGDGAGERRGKGAARDPTDRAAARVEHGIAVPGSTPSVKCNADQAAPAFAGSRIIFDPVNRFPVAIARVKPDSAGLLPSSSRRRRAGSPFPGAVYRARQGPPALRPPPGSRPRWFP